MAPEPPEPSTPLDGPPTPSGRPPTPPDPSGEPQPTYAPTHAERRARRAAQAGGVDGPDGGTERPAATEPVVDIAPPRWFAAVATVAGALVALLGVAVAAGTGSADPLGAVLGLVAGLGLAAMSLDVARRRATTEGDVLVLRQWFRSRTLRRAEVAEFAAVRASFVRWDIVAVPCEGTQVRLWVTRMLPAGRATRQAWLAQLEAWRTWIAPPA